jgi:hypothetical protein
MLQHTTGRPVGRGGTTHQRRSAPPQIWGTGEAEKGGGGQVDGGRANESSAPFSLADIFIAETEGDGDRGDAQRNEHPALLSVN